MKTIVQLSSDDIKEAIAKMYSVPASEIRLKHVPAPTGGDIQRSSLIIAEFESNK